MTEVLTLMTGGHDSPIESDMEFSFGTDSQGELMVKKAL